MARFSPRTRACPPVPIPVSGVHACAHVTRYVHAHMGTCAHLSQVMGGRDLKSGDGLPLLNPIVRFTCGGRKLVNLLDPATASYVQQAAAAEAKSFSRKKESGHANASSGNARDENVLYTGEYGKHGPVPKK